MSRGGQPPDGPNVASDLITSTENEIAGDPQDGFDNPASSGVDRSKKATPLPEGISEMESVTSSGGGSQGKPPGSQTGGGSGKGGNNEPYVDRAAEALEK